jgi:hypothetical protein
MFLKILPVFLLALFSVLPAIAEEEKEKKGITAWDLTCKYYFQGNFVSNLVKGIDCNVSTVAFPGPSVKPINPFGECHFVDNTSKNTYFIPLKSPGEWESFKSHLPTGVTLRKCE